jgi:hypothetical protein
MGTASDGEITDMSLLQTDQALPSHDAPTRRVARTSKNPATKANGAGTGVGPAAGPASGPPTQRRARRRAAAPAGPSRMSRWASELAHQGFAVFPVTPGAKVPLVKDWPGQATRDQHRIAAWWRWHQNANIGISCAASNIFVIDLDSPKVPGRGGGHGQDSLRELAAGRTIPPTRTVVTASGGLHLYFRAPDGVELRNSVGDTPSGLGHLIDTRGVGGFVLAPGSSVNGSAYWIRSALPMAELPGWLLYELTRRQAKADAAAHAPLGPIDPARAEAYGRAALAKAAARIAGAQLGTRNDTLNRAAFGIGRLVGGGVLDRGQAEHTLRLAAQMCGLPDREIASTLRSGMTAGLARPRGIPEDF